MIWKRVPGCLASFPYLKHIHVFCYSDWEERLWFIAVSYWLINVCRGMQLFTVMFFVLFHAVNHAIWLEWYFNSVVFDRWNICIAVLCYILTVEIVLQNDVGLVIIYYFAEIQCHAISITVTSWFGCHGFEDRSGCIVLQRSLMAEWFERASQWPWIYCHELEVIGLNPGRVELGVYHISV